MVHAKNYETVSTFVKVMRKKTLASFFPDNTVYMQLVVHFPLIHTQVDQVGIFHISF